MTRIKKLSTMLISALALSAIILTGEAYSSAAPPASAASMSACINSTPKTTVARIGNYYATFTYNLPTKAGSTYCFNGLNHYSDAIPTTNNALRYGHYEYRRQKPFNQINATNRLYDGLTKGAVLKVQDWNGLDEDGLLGPLTKNVTYWPTTVANYSTVFTVYGPLRVGNYQVNPYV
ncbi:MAG: hypothetical protein LBG60_17415 [Bifidobacteriaceae bacterium]|jgi:hypothetical protein|nr:hypothetical protein [Bifidobacteriaceae bacterium]